jgi:GTP cyclohydrolase I
MRAKVNGQAVEQAVRNLLSALGYNPADNALSGTPARVARFYKEFLDSEAGCLETCFATEGADQMVVVSGIKVWSLCEHHLLPFWADVTMGYFPKARLAGLSKLPRLAWKHARRLQVQERLVEGIADELAQLTGQSDVAVIATGEHLCATMRGVRTPAFMTTSVLRGLFRDDPAVRSEFFGLATSPRR